VAETRRLAASGLKVREIAAHLGIGEQAVRDDLRRALPTVLPEAS
jgi:DNA-directed RNA polymerase specialized sigma24 family protein